VGLDRRRPRALTDKAVELLLSLSTYMQREHALFYSARKKQQHMHITSSSLLRVSASASPAVLKAERTTYTENVAHVEIVSQH
jgi:hypothetical protein